MKDVSDEESAGYDSGHSSSSGEQKFENRKRVLKLKEKKKSIKKAGASVAGNSMVKVKPMKSKFLELEADEGSASDDSEDHEREITRKAKGNK